MYYPDFRREAIRKNSAWLECELESSNRTRRNVRMTMARMRSSLSGWCHTERAPVLYYAMPPAVSFPSTCKQDSITTAGTGAIPKQIQLLFLDPIFHLATSRNDRTDVRTPALCSLYYEQ